MDVRTSPRSQQPVLDVSGLRRSFGDGETRVEAVRGVDLRLQPGEIVLVMGPSGSGKTTLLNLIGCLDTPTSGDIDIDGEAVGALSPGRRADLRARKLGFVFQTFNLIPVLTAYENVEYPLLIHRRGGDTANRRQNRPPPGGRAVSGGHCPAAPPGSTRTRPSCRCARRPAPSCTS